MGVLLGTVAGVGLGAVVQKMTGMKISRLGLLIGGAAGALAGGLIGSDMDRRRCELSKIAQKHNLKMTVSEVLVPASDSDTPSEPRQKDQKEERADLSVLAQDANGAGRSPSGSGEVVPAQPGQKDQKEEKAGLSVSVQDADGGGHFSSGSDKLLPKAQGYFREIAEQYVLDKQVKLPPDASSEQRKAVEVLNNRRVFLLGHTDDAGISRINADLSERRARTVANIFMAAGVPNTQIFYQGAGETLPIADNRTEEGRAKNRRVEIVDLSNGETFQRYLNSRKPRVDYYRPVAPRSEVTVAVSKPQETKTQESRVPGRKAQEDTVRENKPQERTVMENKKTAVPAQPPVENPTPESNSIAPRPPTSTASSSISALEFGGRPAQSQNTVVDIGKIEVSRSIRDMVIPSAHAAEDDVVSSCRNDRPRVANGVKSLGDDREIPTAKYMPNLYNTSWVDTVNGHLVALTHVAVLRDGGAPARNPELLVYKNFNPGADNSKAQADYRATPEVNTYRGENALLYRVFAEGSIRCLDMVIPHADPREAKGSWLYYDHRGGIFVTGFKPHIAKTDR